MPNRPRPFVTAATLAGCLAALLAFELGLRPIARIVHYPEGATRPYVESRADLPLAEVRQYREGLSVAHLDVDGARVTGGAPEAGRPVGLILGDSNVRALSLEDDEVAAAVVERLARDAGADVHVREYGFSGAAGPTYAALAERLLSDWRPEWVAVVLDAGDLGPAPLVGTPNWRMAIGPDLTVSLVRVPPYTLSPTRRAAQSWIDRSTLARVAVHRMGEILRARERLRTVDEEPAFEEATPEGAELVPRATVRALKAAYGDRLFIVYTPGVPVTEGEYVDPYERPLLDACRSEGVECVSTAEAMRLSQDRDGRLSRGFWNTGPNWGHLNANGHRIVGEAIWSAVSARPRRGGA